MELKRYLTAIGVVLMGFAFCGCEKSESPSSSSSGSEKAASAAQSLPAAGAADISRVHWLGKKRLAAEPRAAGFMAVWNLPEGAALESRILDKLALAPWRLLKGDPATNGAPTAALRALLDDIVREESSFEMLHATNAPSQYVFAIRLAEDRATIWRSSLLAVAESLTGARGKASSDNRGWSVAGTNSRVELARVGVWTVVALGPGSGSLLKDTLARIARDNTPSKTDAANVWLTASLDLQRLNNALALGWSLPDGLPRINFTATGDGKIVQTRAVADFPRTLTLRLEPWNIPTNMIHQPTHSFAAMRGFAPWLAASRGWTNLRAGAPPNQLFCWAQPSTPLLTYAVAPMPNAKQFVTAVAERTQAKMLPWLATHRSGKLDWKPEVPEFRWSGLPMISPFLTTSSETGGEFVFAGFAGSTATNLPPPQAVLKELLSRDNTVYYERELTEPRVSGWLYNSQTLRLIGYRAQMPDRDSSAVKFLLAAAPKLGNATTFGTQEGPARMVFTRESSLGLTSVELHLLADWIESPQFPRGFHTLLAPGLPPTGR